MHPRIEKSFFHPRQYIAYCDGTWRVKRVRFPRDHFEAVHMGNRYPTILAKTLHAIGEALDALEKNKKSA